MDWTTIIVAVIGALSGGILAAVATLKWTARKVQFEAKNTEVDYAKNLMETQVNFIVNPLKSEISALRKSVNRLEKAIERIPECQYSENCPVKVEINKNQNENEN